MTLRQYLILMTIGTCLCWIAWFFVILYSSPTEGNLLGLVFFYLSLFLAVVGTFSVIGFLIRRRMIKNDEIVFRHVRHTFRQSIIVALVIVIALILLSINYLTWWTGLLLALLFLFVEGILFTNRKYSNGDYVR